MNRRTRRSRAAMMVTVPVVLAVGGFWAVVALTPTGGTVTVARARVVVGGRGTVIGAPKTKRGARTLPLTPDVADALRRLRKVQTAERLALGVDYTDSGLVVVKEDGQPVRPESYSDAWAVNCMKAGVRALTLHEARHSSVTAMRERGVPHHVVAA